MLWYWVCVWEREREREFVNVHCYIRRMCWFPHLVLVWIKPTLIIWFVIKQWIDVFSRHEQQVLQKTILWTFNLTKVHNLQYDIIILEILYIDFQLFNFLSKEGRETQKELVISRINEDKFDPECDKTLAKLDRSWSCHLCGEGDIGGRKKCNCGKYVKLIVYVPISDYIFLRTEINSDYEQAQHSWRSALTRLLYKLFLTYRTWHPFIQKFLNDSSHFVWPPPPFDISSEFLHWSSYL